MNYTLLSPTHYHGVHADSVEASLSGNSEPICCMEWNREGTLVAAGCVKGVACVWDFCTRSLCCTLSSAAACTQPLTSLSFLSAGKSSPSSSSPQLQLACASHNARCVLVWDVWRQALLCVLRFADHAGLLHVCPRASSRLALVSGLEITPFVLDLGELEAPVVQVADEQQRRRREVRALKGQPGVPNTACGAVYNHRGTHAYYGTQRGKVYDLVPRVEEPRELDVAGTFAAEDPPAAGTGSGSQSAILHVAVSPMDTLLLVQFQRSIQVFHVGSPYALRCTLQAPTRGASFIRSCFAGVHPGAEDEAGTSDSEYVYASTDTHSVCVYKISTAQLCHVEDRLPQDALLLSAHPHLPVLLSYHWQGAIYVWTNVTQQLPTWAPLKPECAPIAASVSYIPHEAEDDLDLLPELHERKCEEELEQPVRVALLEEEFCRPSLPTVAHPMFQYPRYQGYFHALEAASLTDVGQTQTPASTEPPGYGAERDVRNLDLAGII